MLAMSTSCGASFPRAGKPIAGALTELSGLILRAARVLSGKLGHFPEYVRIVQDEQGRILVARQEKGLGFLVRGKQGVFGVAAGFRSGREPSPRVHAPWTARRAALCGAR